MKMHKSITTKRVIEAVERAHFSLDNPGFCLACGEDAEGCEPDAENYKCECCGVEAVSGAENVLMHLA